MPFGVLKQMEEKPLRHEIYKQIHIKFTLFFFYYYLMFYVNTFKKLGFKRILYYFRL